MYIIYNVIDYILGLCLCPVTLFHWAGYIEGEYDIDVVQYLRDSNFNTYRCISKQYTFLFFNFCVYLLIGHIRLSEKALTKVGLILLSILDIGNSVAVGCTIGLHTINI